MLCVGDIGTLDWNSEQICCAKSSYVNDNHKQYFMGYLSVSVHMTRRQTSELLSTINFPSDRLLKLFPWVVIV